MQTLPTYLEGRSKADFARQIGVRADQLSQYLSGYRRPGYNLMLKIEAVTEGAVTVQSWAHVPAVDAAVHAKADVNGPRPLQDAAPKKLTKKSAGART